MKTRILLVDDSEQWRRVVRSIVEAIPEFYVIGEASNGLEAIESCSRLNPDIVLLDTGIPLLNGIEAAKRIRRECPSSKIVFVTQENDADIRYAALATGAQGYVLKANATRKLLPAAEAASRDSRGTGTHGEQIKRLSPTPFLDPS